MSPKALTDFALVDTQGAAASPATLRTHPTLVFFGFTHCPDVCPTTLALLASVQKQVAIPGLKVALISVDPERDTPQQLGKYISSFGGDLIGLTGTPPEISKVTRSFGVAAARVDLPGGDYTMDHWPRYSRSIPTPASPPFTHRSCRRNHARRRRLAPVLGHSRG